MDKRIFVLLFVLFVPICLALEGFSSPQASVSLGDSLVVSDSVVFSSGFVSDDGQSWQAFSLTGRQCGDWIIGQAISDVRTDANYYAVFSCSWSSGWDCSNNWQVYDTQNTVALVNAGVPTADIVVSQDAPNMVKLAADFFQSDIEDMTGATLPIRSAPGDDYDFHVFIGESEYTNQLGITSEGTVYDGYKVVSGPDYLVMLGDDDPYPRDEEMSTEVWDEYTAPDTWRNPMWRRREPHHIYHVNERDGRGSMNAIHDFLEGQGMRWYYPTDFGTIIPQKDTITVSQVDKTINPAFAMRSPFHYYKDFGHLDHEALFGDGRFGTKEEWFRFLMGLGINHASTVVLGGPAHGLNKVTGREETAREHPEYYAVWGGKRMDGLDGSEAKQNLCSEELKQATVRYASTLFDTYGHHHPQDKYVSVWPEDGFTRVSEHSAECRAMATPEYGPDGRISDYVWSFANDVAWDIYDAYGEGYYIMGGAYGAYKLPPRNITNPRGLAPNLAVMISHNRITTANPEQEAYRKELVSDWDAIAPGQVFMNDKYLYNKYGSSSQAVPHFFPNIISEDFQFLDGKVNGEFDEVATNLPTRDINHDVYAATALNMYVTSKMMWDPGVDVDALLDEYYVLYYGPAAQQMKQLVDYSEANLRNDLVSNPIHLSTMRELAEQALSQVPEGSVYAQRIQPLLGLMNTDFVGDEITVQECQTLTSPGSTYVLNQPITSNDQCLVIDNNGITLDCKGFSIGSVGTAVTVVARDTNRGHYFTIKNCVIDSSAGRGINVGHIGHGTIDNNVVRANRTAISAGRSEHLVITNNYAYSSEMNALRVALNHDFGRISRGVIDNNVFESVEESAARLYDTNRESITNNEFYSERQHGLHLIDPKNLNLVNNTIESARKNGLYIDNPTNVTQENNVILNG